MSDKLMDEAQIAELAKLSPLVYEQKRKDEAKMLGVRAPELDKLVYALRNVAQPEGNQLFTDPLPWAEEVDGQQLLSDVESVFNNYMVMPHGVAAATALWIAHTHCFECFEHTPRLNISAPGKQCGKTVMLDVVGTLVPRSVRTENATTAVVFRLIDAHRPTLLIDEYDAFLGDNNELRGALNAGHKVGGSMMRCVGDDHDVKLFKTFAPVALAGIGELPGTLHDRSIIVRLQRALEGEVNQQFDSRNTKAEQILCRKLARWSQDNAKLLKSAEPDMDGIFNRHADNWRPLFAIADAVGGEWPNRVRYLSKTLNMNEESDTKNVLLLRDIQKVFSQMRGDKIFPYQLTDKLINLEDAPWSGWKRGLPITQNTVSFLLKPFAIKSRAVRIGEIVKKGYKIKHFKDAFTRYIPSQSVTTLQVNEYAASSESQSVTLDDDVTLQNPRKANESAICNVVTLQNGPDGEEESFEVTI